MDPTAIQAGHPQPAAANGSAYHAGHPTPARPTPGPQVNPFWRALEIAASLRITVTLFALAFVLVFYGTLAQVDSGMHTVQQRYFKSMVVLIPMDVVLFNANHAWKDKETGEVTHHTPGWLPFPGGRLIGGALLLNLLCAYIVRFRIRIKSAGILLLHAGIIVMLAGEIITQFMAVEGRMQIEEKHGSNTVIHPGSSDLVFERAASDTEDEVIAVPDRLLKEGATIDDPRLPAVLRIRSYMPNSDLKDIDDPKAPNLATAGKGLHVAAVLQSEVSGVANEQKYDIPAAYVTLVDRKTNKDLATYLLSGFLKPEWITVDGQRYRLSLQFKRTSRPFTLYLDKFDFKKHANSDVARDYRSHIRLTNPQTHEDRPVEIYMNAPLRYEGETFYQASVLQNPVTGAPSGTELQVVRNPGYLLPYFSCAMVALGMLIHFGILLDNFIFRQTGVSIGRMRLFRLLLGVVS